MSTGSKAHSAAQIVQLFTTADEEFKRAVQDRFERAADEAGLLDENGELDVDEIVERAYAVLRTKQVVNIEQGNDDRYSPATSSTKEELAAEVFTAGPTAADAELNAIEKKAYEKCLATVWNHTVPTGRGRIQKRLDADRLLLVRGKVYRNSNTIDAGLFVTTNPELILREYLGPRLDKLRALTEALEGDFELARERDKALEGPMQAAIEAAVAEVTAKLPVAALGFENTNEKRAGERETGPAGALGRAARAADGSDMTAINTNTKPRPTREVLLETIGARPGIKRAEMIAVTGLSSGAIDPARIRLWQAGLIEPDTEAGWEDALNNRIKDVGWTRVDGGDRQAEVKRRAIARKERNAGSTAEEQAIEIVEALKDPVVNKLVLEMTKDTEGSRRSQKRAAQALRAQQMARKREAAEAEREKSANASFKRNLARLWEARGAVGAIDQHLIEERARAAEGKQRRISNLDWALALNDVRAIITSFGAMWQNLRDIQGQNEPCPACGAVRQQPRRALGTFVIDGYAVEETDDGIVDAEVVT